MKEKQIEEMAEYIFGNAITHDTRFKEDCRSIAIDLYTAGYRKQSENMVEVVRCKDCAHYIEMKGYDYNGRKARSCVWHSQLRRENDFCSDAIRKGGAE